MEMNEQSLGDFLIMVATKINKDTLEVGELIKLLKDVEVGFIYLCGTSSSEDLPAMFRKVIVDT